MTFTKNRLVQSLPKSIFALISILLQWQACASAQTLKAPKPTPSIGSITSTTPSIATSTSATITATKKPVGSSDIYRWIDKNGKVQYGNQVPEESMQSARKVDTRSNIVSSRVPVSVAGAPQPKATDQAAPARVPTTEREKCEFAWQQYNESVACFAKYRQGKPAGSGNRVGVQSTPEAQEKCQSLSEPAACR